MSEFTTRDPERAHAFLRRAYVDHVVRITGDTTEFRMTHIGRGAGPFSSATLAHTMSVEHLVPRLGFVLVARVLAGRVEREVDGETLRARRGDVFLVAPPERPFRVSWDRVWLQLVRLETAALADIAGELPRFTSYQPTSPTTARFCVGVLDFLDTDVLSNKEVMASPILVDGVARTLATAVLDTFPNTAVADPPPDRTVVAPATLRRAVEFVDTNAHRPIGLADIAAAARVTPRGLRQVFRLHLGTTPTDYLRTVRLDHAHRELVNGDPGRGDTIAAVALRWGFPNEDAFTADYRAAFGHGPRQTLHA